MNEDLAFALWQQEMRQGIDALRDKVRYGRNQDFVNHLDVNMLHVLQDRLDEAFQVVRDLRSR